MQHAIETGRANALVHSLAADSPALDWQNVDDAWKLDSAKALVKMFRHWGGQEDCPSFTRPFPTRPQPALAFAARLLEASAPPAVKQKEARIAVLESRLDAWSCEIITLSR